MGVTKTDAVRAGPTLAPESRPALTGAFRSEPYRLLFPLGFVLAWAGVLHFLLLGVGWGAAYRPIFHAMAQIQGTFTCFALGFLLTFVPRRTSTFPASRLELFFACAGPI